MIYATNKMTHRYDDRITIIVDATTDFIENHDQCNKAH